jgi:phosphoglycolate phosphatase-like HAD superfamily hydrolase
MYENNIGSIFNDNAPIQYLSEKIRSDKVLLLEIWRKFNGLKSYLIEKESLLPGVLDYLKDAASLGLRIGLASSSDSIWINYHINRFGLRNYFNCILTKDDVNKAKPFPDIYLLSLSRLGHSTKAKLSPWKILLMVFLRQNQHNYSRLRYKIKQQNSSILIKLIWYWILYPIYL